MDENTYVLFEVDRGTLEQRAHKLMRVPSDRISPVMINDIIPLGIFPRREYLLSVDPEMSYFDCPKGNLKEIISSQGGLY
jgi:hypothetical protein